MNKPPTQTSLKDEIIEQYYFNERAAKRHQLVIIKANKLNKRYALDKLSVRKDQKLIILRPYHCNFNGI